MPRDAATRGCRVTGAVLVGGRSRRMGSDKEILEVDGRTLLEWALGALGAVCDDLLVVARADQPLPAVAARVIRDHIRDAGPLGGLEAALGAASSELVCVLAVDMPLARASVLRLMIDAARAHPEADVTALRSSAGLEPLHAVYRRRVRDAVERRIRVGDLRAVALLDHLAVLEIPRARWSAADPGRVSTTNVNSPEDLARLKASRTRREPIVTEVS